MQKNGPRFLKQEHNWCKPGHAILLEGLKKLLKSRQRDLSSYKVAKALNARNMRAQIISDKHDTAAAQCLAIQI